MSIHEARPPETKVRSVARSSSESCTLTGVADRGPAEPALEQDIAEVLLDPSAPARQHPTAHRLEREPGRDREQGHDRQHDERPDAAAGGNPVENLDQVERQSELQQVDERAEQEDHGEPRTRGAPRQAQRLVGGRPGARPRHPAGSRVIGDTGGPPARISRPRRSRTFRTGPAPRGRRRPPRSSGPAADRRRRGRSSASSSSMSSADQTPRRQAAAVALERQQPDRAPGGGPRGRGRSPGSPTAARPSGARAPPRAAPPRP